MAERAADFPRPSHGACEGGRADSCRHGCRRVATRRRGPWPPGPADSRPGRNDGRDAGGRARLTLAGEAGPARASPSGPGGLREPDRATGDLACVREAARQRAGATLCRHGMSRDGRTPTDGPERRRCRHLRDRPRPVGLGDAGLRGLPRGSLGRRVGRGRLRRAGGQGRGGRQGLRPGAAR